MKRLGQVTRLRTDAMDAYEQLRANTWQMVEAMQDPIPERPAGDWWLTLAEVFHAD